MDANPTCSDGPDGTFESIVRPKPKMDGRPVSGILGPEVQARPAARRRLRALAAARRPREQELAPSFRNLWGCFPVTDLKTFIQWLIVWGGTILIIFLTYLVTFPPNYCSPGSNAMESCPGMWYANAVHSQTHTTASTTTTTATSNRYWPNHDDIYMTKSGTVNSVVSDAGASIPTAAIAVTSVIDGPHHVVQMRAQPVPVDPSRSSDHASESSSDSVEPPASVFLTFTPTEFLTETTPTPTAHPPVSCPTPPAVSHPPPPPVENTRTPPAEAPTTPTAAPNMPTISGGEGYDSTTTVVELTTIHVSGNDSTPAQTHTTKTSWGGITHVPLVLGGVLAVIMGVVLGI